MTRYFLSRVQVEGFRGINNSGAPLDLKLKPDRINSVFAPNGLGKSSVFEALCYCIQGTIPKLANLPKGEKPDDYYCNRFHDSGQAVVTLTLTPTDGSEGVEIRVERSSKGARSVTSPSGYVDPDGLLEELNTELALLDHRTFLRFVEDTPLRRGRALSALLGLAAISEFRQALETLAHAGNLNADLETSVVRERLDGLSDQVGENENEIRSACESLLGPEAAGTIDEEDISKRAGDALSKVELLKGFFESTAFQNVDFESVKAAIKDEETGEKRARLAAVIGAQSDLNRLAPGEESNDDQRKLVHRVEQRIEALQSTSGLLLHALYEALDAVFASDEWDDPTKCPTCDSSQEQPLDEINRERLKEYAKVVGFERDIQELWTTSQWVKTTKRLEESSHLGIETDARKLTQLDSVFRSGQPTSDDVQKAIAQAKQIEGLRKKKVQEFSAERARLEGELPPSLVQLTQQVQCAQALQHSLRVRKKNAEIAEKLKERLHARDRWATFVERAKQTFSDAEVRLSTAMTSKIEKQYREFYGQITCNPDVEPCLRKATGSEELHLRLAKFYGLEDLSAATLLSESYRNALALAIYLSAALRVSSPARFMVLDDVTSSFDAGHQWYLMELLRTAVGLPGNKDGPQIVLLSHDGLLEKYFDTMSSEADWHHQKLQGLPPIGSVSSHAQGENRLRESATRFLDAGQIAQGEPLVRQYLEYRLLEVIRSLSIPVPLDFSIRDQKKMVRNCLDAIRDNVSLHEKAGVLIMDGTQLGDMTAVHLPALIANWVSHYATGVATSVTPYTYKGALDAVDHFCECFKYDCICGGAPQRKFYKNLSAKRCGC